jgi:hypothetical protein
MERDNLVVPLHIFTCLSSDPGMKLERDTRMKQPSTCQVKTKFGKIFGKISRVPDVLLYSYKQ